MKIKSQGRKVAVMASNSLKYLFKFQHLRKAQRPCNFSNSLLVVAAKLRAYLCDFHQERK
jgi:hypothetical protein